MYNNRVVPEHMSFLDAVRAGVFTVPGDGDVDFNPTFVILGRAGGGGGGGWSRPSRTRPRPIPLPTQSRPASTLKRSPVCKKTTMGEWFIATPPIFVYYLMPLWILLLFAVEFDIVKLKLGKEF